MTRRISIQISSVETARTRAYDLVDDLTVALSNENLLPEEVETLEKIKHEAEDLLKVIRDFSNDLTRLA